MFNICISFSFVKQKRIVHIRDSSVPQRAQLEAVQQKFGLIAYFEHFELGWEGKLLKY